MRIKKDLGAGLLMLVAGAILAAPLWAQDVGREAIPKLPEDTSSNWKEDPNRLHRHLETSMAAEDYVRALEATGMNRALAAGNETPGRVFGGDASPAAGPWTEVGPQGKFGGHLGYNGRVAGMRIVDDGGGGYYIYAGASGGGLWQSHSSAPETWTAKAQNLPNPSIRAFAFDPLNSNHIVVCTGDPGRYKGAGVYVTWNGGTSWTQATLPSVPDYFYDVEFRLGSSSYLVAASSRGILLSADGGVTWSYQWQGSSSPWDQPATALVLHPTLNSRMYAVAARRGFLRSTDTGLTWGPVPGSAGLPADTLWGRASLAIEPLNPDNLAVLICDLSNNLLGVWRSVDGGVSWFNSTGNLPDLARTQGFHAQAITFEPGLPNRLWIGSVDMALTTDGGTNWTVYNSYNDIGHSDTTRLRFSAVAGNHLLWMCNDGGLYRRDVLTGTTVSLHGTGSAALSLSQIDHLESRRTAKMIGLIDNGQLYSQDTGATWTSLGAADGGDPQITDPEAFDFWYWVGGDWALYRILAAGSPVQVPIDATASLHYDPFDQQVYVPAGTDVFTAGAYADPVIWSQAALPALHPNPSYKIWQLIGSRADGKTLYFRFRNGLRRDLAAARWTGSTWTVNTSLGLAPMAYTPPGGKTVPTWVQTISPSTERPGEAWAGFKAPTDSVKIMHTTDYGATWEDVTGNLTACQVVYALAPTPFDPRTLYAGTEVGVFRTTDGGANWMPFQDGMPIVQVKDLKHVVDHTTGGNHRLVAGTYGRGVWSRDMPAKPIVYVDKTNGGFEDGSIEHPYNTVAEGVAACPAGGIVAVHSDTYQEPQTVNKNILLTTWAGVTTIR